MIKLTLEDIRALREAYDDAARAWGTYDRVVRDFGPVAPFPALRDDALLHLEKLEALFREYGLDLPNTRCREPIPHFRTIPQAVAAALNAERQHVDVYERLEGTAREPALRQQIVNLEHAAADQHVPSLEACVEETTPGRASTHRRTRND